MVTCDNYLLCYNENSIGTITQKVTQGIEEHQNRNISHNLPFRFLVFVLTLKQGIPSFKHDEFFTPNI
jgi:hypothetical protein